MQYCKACGVHRIANTETFCIECMPQAPQRRGKVARKRTAPGVKAVGALAGAVLHLGKK